MNTVTGSNDISNNSLDDGALHSSNLDDNNFAGRASHYGDVDNNNFGDRAFPSGNFNDSIVDPVQLYSDHLDKASSGNAEHGQGV